MTTTQIDDQTYAEVRKRIFDTFELPPRHKLLVLAILAVGPEARPSLWELSRMCSTHEKAIVRQVKELEQARVIRVERTLGRANRYHVEKGPYWLDARQFEPHHWMYDALEDLPPLLTLQEAAAVLRVSATTIHRMMGYGGPLRSIRHNVLGGKHLIPRTELRRYLNTRDDV